MTPCTRCGSYAINPHCHGRNDIDLDLCDVCYWRKRAESLTAPPARAVDLDQFREAVRYSSRALPHKDLAEKMTELLALIDQQAGKGGA